MSKRWEDIKIDSYVLLNKNNSTTIFRSPKCLEGSEYCAELNSDYHNQICLVINKDELDSSIKVSNNGMSDWISTKYIVKVFKNRQEFIDYVNPAKKDVLVNEVIPSIDEVLEDYKKEINQNINKPKDESYLLL